MKKVLTAMVCLMMSIMMQAGDVSRQEALEKAQQFMPNKEFKQQSDSRRKVSANGSQSSPYYVFNAENNGGFVIVSGDDRTEAILGYADKGELDAENAPENVKWLLDYYDQVITAMGKIPEDSDEQVSTHRKAMAKVATKQTIEPLLKTQWNQMDPYNKYCPEWIGTGLRYPAGCVAVAMAQIINYHRWPEGNTSSVEGYVSGINAIAMPALPSTSFDWDNMTEDDIARLMLYCGQATKMQYEASGSGAYNGDAAKAFHDVFGFSRGCQILHRTGYADDSWVSIIYEELKEKRPIFYTGQGHNGYHAFVVDGYEDGRFHVNWGWGGDLDGYFLLTGLDSDENSLLYNKNQSVICGIQKPINAEDPIHNQLFVKETYSAKQNVSRKHAYESFPEVQCYCILTNDLMQDVTLSIGYGLYCNDELIQVFSQEQHTFTSGEAYMFFGFAEFGSEIEDGTYRVAAICRKDEKTDWQMVRGSSYYSYIIEIEGNTLSLCGVPDYSPENENDYQDYGIQTIDGITYQLSHRYGEDVAEVLPYRQNGQYSGDVVIPNKVEYIGHTFRIYEIADGVFDNCENLTSLSVGLACGIYNCPKLSKIDLREGVTHFGRIRECPVLKEIEFPSTFQDISAAQFLMDCEQLKIIRFNADELIIQFELPWDEYSLPALTHIYFPMKTPPSLLRIWNGVPLDDVPARAHTVIHIPQGTLNLYQQSQWKNWTFLEDLPPVAPKAITWGYLHGNSWRDERGRTWGGMNIVTNDSHDIEMAMRVPAEDLNLYKGCKITHIEIYADGVSTIEDGNQNYQYVFITKRDVDYLVKQSFDVVRGKWNMVELLEPYIITGDELFVGVGRHYNIEMIGVDNTYQPDALWVRSMKGEDDCLFTPGVWYNEGKNRGFGHPFPLRFTIEGDNVPQGAVIRELAVAEGDGLNIQAVVRNRSLGVVQSYIVSWTTEEGQTGTQTYETNLMPNTSETIMIPLPSSLATGHHAVTFDISTLDGQANGLMGLNAPTIHLYNGTEAIVIYAGNYTRKYGEDNPVLYEITGLTPNGTPEVVCEATSLSPIGEYPIELRKGSITNENVVFVNGGKLTVTKAPLTVTANSYAIKQGTALPEYGYTCLGFKNGESESVLSPMPTLTCSATSSNELGTYDINIAGAEADNYDITHQNGVLQVSIPGDVTGTGKVDVQDATLTVNYILGNNDDKEEDYKFAVSDMNDDDVVDVFDVTGMIGAILSTEVSAKARKVSALQHPTVDEQLQVDDSADGLTLDIERPERFTSFQMDVEVPDGVELTGARLTDDETGHAVRFAQVGKNRYRVLGLSMKSERLKAATSGLLELSLSDVGSVQIDDIMFVTPKGEAVRFGAPSYNNATGIEGVTTSQIEEDIYDLSGRKMSVRREQLPKGVYIINQQKVVIK